MRINVYSQELTDEVQVEQKTSNTGRVYSAVRFMLHSSDRLHHTIDDDDRSGITFWLPRSDERLEAFARALEEAAYLVRHAPREGSGDGEN